MIMKKNLMYGITVDRAHHIIIGNAVPNLEYEMKQVRGFTPIGMVGTK
jgi:hypothetical protein